MAPEEEDEARRTGQIIVKVVDNVLVLTQRVAIVEGQLCLFHFFGALGMGFGLHRGFHVYFKAVEKG